MCDACVALVEAMNANAVVDDLTRRNIPYAEMREARGRLAIANLDFLRYVEQDFSQDPGFQWKLKAPKDDKPHKS